MQQEDEAKDLAAQVEFAQAFYSMSKLLCGRLVAGGLAQPDELVEHINLLAHQAGRELQRALDLADYAPNSHLLQIAQEVRLIRNPSDVIEGGKPVFDGEDQVGG